MDVTGNIHPADTLAEHKAKPLRTEAEYRAERLTLEQQAERDCKAAVEYFAPVQSLIDQMFGGLK